MDATFLHCPHIIIKKKLTHLSWSNDIVFFLKVSDSILLDTDLSVLI